MVNSKVYDLLQILSNKERKKLVKFLQSPFFNENEDLEQMYSILLGKQPPSEKADLWHRLFPDRSYDDLRLRHLMSDLLALVEQFLATERFLATRDQQQIHLLRSLRERDAAKLYEFVLRKTERRRKADRLIDTGHFLDQFLIEAERNIWMEQSANRSGVTNLQASVHSLDRFYLFNKLKYSCMMLNNRNVMEINYRNLLLDEILEQMESSPYADDPAIAMYFQIHKLLSEPEIVGHYEALKSLLTDHAGYFSPEEGRYLYAFALNYCIGRINKGESRFLQEIFGLYQQALSREVLFEKGRLSPWDYKNIVVVGLRLAEYGWVEDLIRNYKERIAPEYRENAFTYNLAKLHFYKKEYGEVLRLLQQVEYEDVFYNLDSKVMLLKIYFELQEIEALDSLIDSFRTFLRRNKLISDDHRTNYLNLIRFVKKLSRLRPGDTARLKKIRTEVESSGQVADANWLRGKLEEVETAGFL